MARFDEAFERVQKLVREFEANEPYYLSANYQESEVRTDYIDKFWNALGWDVRHKYQTNPREQEVKVEKNPDANATGRRADYAFYYKPDYRNPVFFVEAKKPSVKLHGPKGYHQILKYGKNAGTPIGVLMDFEEFHVVDCRYLLTEAECYPLAKIKSFHYKDFLDPEKFGDIYWTFSHEALEEGKLKAFTSTLPKLKGKGKVKNQAEAEKPIDESFLATLEDYRLTLAKAFKKADESLTAEELTEATQKVIDRLVFIRFLEDKNIEADYIVDQIAAKKGSAWKSFLAWSKELDVKYNGIVFKSNQIDSPSFKAPDDAVFSKLCEDISHQHSPFLFSYIPIEILGSIYERFLGKVVTATAKRADIEEKPEVRKAGGVYYTPKYIVEYIVANTVGKILDDKIPTDCSKLRFADIACGSGSFLIAVYDAVLHHVEAYYNAHPDEARKAKCIEIDKDVFALSLAQKRQILTDNIYGVDIDNQAVEVAQLSLFLKLLETESGSLVGQMTFERTKILPDLSKNILCGNSLVEYDIAQLFPLSSEDEHKIKPFDFRSSFKDIMSKGGFDAIVGNPPYIRIQAMKEWAPVEVEYYKSKYSTASVGNYDIYTVFIQRALSLISSNGQLGYIVPHKFMNSKYGAPLRQIVSQRKQLKELVHFGDQQIFKGATTYTCIMVLSSTPNQDFVYRKVSGIEEWIKDTGGEKENLSSEQVTPNEWSFSGGEGYGLYTKLSAFSTKLGDISQMFVGLQTSADTVFLFKDVKKSSNNTTTVFSKELDEQVEIESEILKPVVRSGKIGRYNAEPSALVLFPYYNSKGKYSLIPEKDFKEKYPQAWSYLLKNKTLLSEREHGKFLRTGWYQLYPKNLDAWEKQKIMMPYMVTHLSAYPDSDDLFFVNVTTGGFGIIIEEKYGSIKYFTGLLNSKVLDWFFKKVTTTFNSGYYAANKQYLVQLPIPNLNLSNATERGQHDKMVSLVEQMLDAKKRLTSARTESEKTQAERKCEYLDNEIEGLVYQLYGLTEEEIKIVEGV